MNYEHKMKELLNEHMTNNAYKFWSIIEKKIGNLCWNKPSSSTGKFHKKEGGYVPSISEHTYEMLYATIQNYALFGISSKTKDSDLLLFAVSLHDGLKYGPENSNLHTDVRHDKLMADRIELARKSFNILFTDIEINILVDTIRYHQGPWSTDVNGDFNFRDFHPFVLFVHTLDMLSSRNCLKVEEK